MATFSLIFLVISLGILFENRVALGMSPTPKSFPINQVSTSDKKLFNSKGSLDIPYYNLTDAINKQDLEEIRDVLNYTSKVYYSTDLLISNILDLSWVAETLLKYHPDQDQNKQSICLMLSFELANKNQSDLNWRHMSDILYKPVKYSKEDPRLQILRKFLCKVALDFQVTTPTSQYFNSQLYAKSVQISFTKYAKKIVSSVMGIESKIPVGIIYSEQQTGRDHMLLEQEVKYADFIIINVPFSPISRMPMKYNSFTTHLSRVLKGNFHFLMKHQIIRENFSNLSMPLTLMVTWEDPELDLCPYSQTPISAYEKVLNSSEAAYLELFQEYLGISLRHKHNAIEIVSGTNFDFRRTSVSFENSESSLRKVAEVIPYLYIQQVDTTPCQMKKMLAQTSDVFDSLIVNEYTWSTMISLEPEMQESKEETKCVLNKGPLRVPENIIMFASRGIGKRWDEVHGAFEDLIEGNPSIVGVNISTLVFSAEDVDDSLRSSSYYATYHHFHSDTGIKKFVREWVARNMSGIGCAVDITQILLHSQKPDYIGSYAVDQCYPIWQNSSLLVWQYKLPFMIELSYNFSYDFKVGSVKRDLFHLLVARENIKSYAPDKEVIIQILANDLNSTQFQKTGNSTFESTTEIPAHVKQLQEFQLDIYKWAKIHELTVIFKPVFDLNNPICGIFPLPEKN